MSVPSDFPHINITTHDNPDAGLIFMNNHSVGQRYNVIFDNAGAPVWYMRTADQRLDMKVQPNGMLTMVTHIGGTHFIGLNHHYEEVASYWTVNGYSVDEHELLILEDGTYFLIGAHFETVDLSRYISGGNTSAVLAENCIQQFTPAGELIFQWRAWDHLDVAGQLNIAPVTNPGDFPHMNAIAVDTDGHLLLSSRYTSEVTKINADTGEMIWRLGGSHNQFTYVNDPLHGPSCQHAIRPLGNNRYTLFDNGNGHRPWASRAVEYELNPNTLTATVVWQYFRVAAVDDHGVEGAFSNEDSVVVSSIKPGQNMVANGDFSGGMTAWSTELAGTAAMTWTVSGGYSNAVITNRGAATSQIQLRQTGIPLVLGNTYVLEFDAWSDGPRTIEAKVTSANNTSYYGITTSAISPVRKRLRSVFTMSAFSDFNSRVVFSMGTSTHPVYLDNISLFNPPPGDFNLDGRVDLLDLKVLTGEWLKQQSGLSSDLDADGNVDFKDFGHVGDSWSGSP